LLYSIQAKVFKVTIGFSLTAFINFMQIAAGSLKSDGNILSKGSELFLVNFRISTMSSILLRPTNSRKLAAWSSNSTLSLLFEFSFKNFIFPWLKDEEYSSNYQDLPCNKPMAASHPRKTFYCRQLGWPT
jgi:hypothetical protein